MSAQLNLQDSIDPLPIEHDFVFLNFHFNSGKWTLLPRAHIQIYCSDRSNSIYISVVFIFPEIVPLAALRFLEAPFAYVLRIDKDTSETKAGSRTQSTRETGPLSWRNNVEIVQQLGSKTLGGGNPIGMDK